MVVRYILSEYLEQAVAQASYDKLEDSSFVGRIAACKGAVAFGTTLESADGQSKSCQEVQLIR